MQHQIISRFMSAACLSVSLLFFGCSNDASEQAAGGNAPTEKPAGPVDTVAHVGGQIITFTQLNTMLNSSPMVGLSIPALGTRERNQVIITLLDKVISANLIYLDAKKKGTDKLAAYTSDIENFENGVLISMYRSRELIGDVAVTEQEIQDFYQSSISPDTELTDDVKLAIEAKIRKIRHDKLKNSAQDRLREGARITINEQVLSADSDSDRSDADVVATVNDVRITWRDVEMQMRGADYRASLSPFYIDNDEERAKRLDEHIDNVLMLEKARAAGLHETPEFDRRTAEYRKTRLINVHRSGLTAEWQPSEDELKAYYVENMDTLVVPEARKVQMVVVGTKEEAESIKQKIDQGEITMFQAAQQYSLDPNAKRTLGDMGWVSQGTGFAGLDEFTFNLEPEAVGGPVESPTGWHLVKVLDVTDAHFDNFDDPQTRRRALRSYMQKKFSDYVVDLRKNHFEVAVYEDVLNEQFQNEADYIAELTQKARQEGSVTQQRTEDLQKYIPPSVQQ